MPFQHFSDFFFLFEQIFTSPILRNGGGYVFICVCLSVCLSVCMSMCLLKALLKNYQTNLHDILCVTSVCLLNIIYIKWHSLVWTCYEDGQQQNPKNVALWIAEAGASYPRKASEEVQGHTENQPQKQQHECWHLGRDRCRQPAVEASVPPRSEKLWGQQNSCHPWEEEQREAVLSISRLLPMLCIQLLLHLEDWSSFSHEDPLHQWTYLPTHPLTLQVTPSALTWLDLFHFWDQLSVHGIV